LEQEGEGEIAVLTKCVR
jgi:hypothetical protein